MDNSVTIELEYEQVQSIVRNTLIADFEALCVDIEALKSLPLLKRHEKEDLENNLKYRKALKRAIKYYSVPGSMDSYFKGWD